MISPECPFVARPHGPIHLVVPKRPGADLDLLRAKLEGVPALLEHDVIWHVPHRRGDIVELTEEAACAAASDGGLLVAAGGDGTINAVARAAQWRVCRWVWCLWARSTISAVSMAWR